MYKNLLLLFIIAVAISSCLTSNPCLKYYSFEFPVKVTAQDTFSVGDTIWYEMDLSNQLLDKNSGSYIDFTDYELYFSLNFSKVDTGMVYGATLLFDLYAEVGEIKQNVNGFAYTYIHFDDVNNKKFRIGVIPKHKGVFSSSISLPSYLCNKEVSDTERLNIGSENCIEYMCDESGAKINNGNINYYLVDGVCQWTTDSLEICYGTYDESASKGGFAFVVN
ncbi:hypothetical protein [Aureispira sp. CCB-E]|uniref:hypothetical protein n=1 Tax=Aureispira sp. CCB-E TaxID=3051121 RepID=UPI0028684A26|nr:hypothetical protein [Aureispira sp. CCB-E]WMX17031.1 hypothetical protein QP953_11675 [Aureispira sp. CCB-E]